MDYYSWRDGCDFESLLGKTLTDVIVEDDTITFKTADGETYVMYHEQDCCESVVIEDINGNIDDLIGYPVLLAEEVSQEGDSEWGSVTWTFYKIATVKGTITIRWHGESNGYYSESVDFVLVPEGESQ